MFVMNSTHYLIMNIRNKNELQKVTIIHSGDIDWKYTSKPNQLLTIDTALPTDGPLRSTSNLVNNYH